MQAFISFILNRDPLTTISDFAGISTGILAVIVTIWVFFSQKAMERQDIFTKISFELILNFIKPFNDTKQRLRAALAQKDPNEKAIDLLNFLKKYPLSTHFTYWNEHKVDIYISFERLKHTDSYERMFEINLFIKDAIRFADSLDMALKTLESAVDTNSNINTIETFRSADNDTIEGLKQQLNLMEISVNSLISRQPELCIEKHLREIEHKA